MVSNEINNNSALLVSFRGRNFVVNNNPNVAKESAVSTKTNLPIVDAAIDKFGATRVPVSMLEASEENLLYNRQSFLKRP